VVRERTSFYGLITGAGIFAVLVMLALATRFGDTAQHLVWWFAGICCPTAGFLLGSALRGQAKRMKEVIEHLPAFSLPPMRTAWEFEGTVEAAHAVSERVQRQLYLADEDRLKLESVLDSMQDAVVAVDSAGRIQWSNTRMQRLLHRGAATDSTGVRVGQALVHTVRDPEVLECVRLALAGDWLDDRPEARTYGTRATSLVPGRIFEVNASPMPGGGAVAVLRDVTRIEEVEQTQRDFIANVSHELRTPLTSIMGYVETLLDSSGEGGRERISADAREFLATILKNATRMNRLTEDLLLMARVERPAAELQSIPVPASTLLGDAVDALRGLLDENDASLEIEQNTSTEVFADPDAMLQVLGNLIENAIKYGQGKGAVGPRVVLRACEVVDPYPAVEFHVQDFGTGIASEHLGRIFERFYRVDKTRSRDSGGTGLGLSIARHIIHMQGGAIWAESELGKGTTFCFTLPTVRGLPEPGHG
jgi:two-component system phosphate regulon sensor histidine kinase PhoR